MSEFTVESEWIETEQGTRARFTARRVKDGLYEVKTVEFKKSDLE